MSDGIGTCLIVFNRETMSEVEMQKMVITENSVIVLRGRLSRQPNDTGTTVLVMNEAPRLVFTGGSQVLGRIGQPVSLLKACEQKRYEETTKD